MSDNPLEDDATREDRIRKRAYHLWEGDGSPHGQADEYWERARELVGMEENPQAGQIPVRAEPAVEEASLQQNLGEFPDRFSDQGDRVATPERAHRVE